MFDWIVDARHTARRDVVPLVISWAVHTLAIGAVVLLPVLFATDRLPAAPKEILTYVELVAPPPPPPPPPAVVSKPAPAVKRSAARPTPVPRSVPQGPIVAPRELPPVADLPRDGETAGAFDDFDGVAGGIAGGIPGGIVGGVVGSIPDVTPPPPPPPAVRAPVRTGGQIEAPALLKRVPPVYPPIAVSAQVQGVVILEATVGRDGRVEDVTVLRSLPLLDKAAIDAVRQWEYAPLLLNGRAERFVLTVTVNFSLS